MLENAIKTVIGKLVVMTEGCEDRVEIINPKASSLPESYQSKEELKLNGVNITSLQFEDRDFSALVIITKNEAFVIKYTRTNKIFCDFVIHTIYSTIIDSYTPYVEEGAIDKQNLTSSVLDNVISEVAYETSHKSRIESMMDELKYRAPFEERADNIRGAIDGSTTVTQALRSAKDVVEREIPLY